MGVTGMESPPMLKAANLFWSSASCAGPMTPEESTVARAVVSVNVATGETMEEVFTVVDPPPPKAPGGPEVMFCCWMGTTKA